MGKSDRIFRSATLPGVRSLLPPHCARHHKKRVAQSDTLHAIHSPPQAGPMQGTPTRDPPCSGPPLQPSLNKRNASSRRRTALYDGPHNPQTIIRRHHPILTMMARAAQHRTARSTVVRDGSAAGPWAVFLGDDGNPAVRKRGRACGQARWHRRCAGSTVCLSGTYRTHTHTHIILNQIQAQRNAGHEWLGACRGREMSLLALLEQNCCAALHRIEQSCYGTRLFFLSLLS